MSHSGVLCQEASDSAQPWRKECGIQLPLGVGTRASVHLRCVSAAGEGGTGAAPVSCSCSGLASGLWPWVGKPLSLPSLWKCVLATGQVTYLVV